MRLFADIPLRTLLPAAMAHSPPGLALLSALLLSGERAAPATDRPVVAR